VLIVPGQLLLGPTHSRRADDKSHPLIQLDLAHNFLEAFPVLLVLDLPGNAAALLVRHQDKVTPRQGDVRGKQGPFALAHLPHDLDDNFLSHLQKRPAVAVTAFRPVFSFPPLGEIILAHVPKGKKTVLLSPIVDEGRLETSFDLHDDTFVDVARYGLLDGHLDIVIQQFAVIDDGHPFLFRMYRVDKHLFSHVFYL